MNTTIEKNTRDLQIFDFKDEPVRVSYIDGELWFCASDVCRILEIKNSRKAVSRLHEDEKGVTTSDTLGGQQSMTYVSESGLFALIFTSRKPIAQEFRRWVTGEVLPAIRKTGRYEMTGTLPTDESLPEPDPEITLATTIGFLEFGPPLVRSWSLSKKIYFALSTRRLARGIGVEWRTEFDERFGRVQIVPVELLSYVAHEIVRQDRALLSAGDGDDPDIDELVNLLASDVGPGEKRQYTFARVFELAREGGLFGLMPADVLDQRTRCLFGKRITAATGKRYGNVVFDARGSYRMRHYIVRRIGSRAEAEEELAAVVTMPDPEAEDAGPPPGRSPSGIARKGKTA
ncbi:hypothetical protein BH20VER3_BH20VER3_00720 [soil metagenome]